MFTLYREDALRRHLEILFQSTPGLRAAVIGNVDGLVVTSYPPEAEDLTNPTGDHSLAATTALIIGLAERTLERLAQGALDRVMIEGEEGVVAVFPCTDDAALAVLIAKDAKLGLTLLAVRKTANDIKAVLSK